MSRGVWGYVPPGKCLFLGFMRWHLRPHLTIIAAKKITNEIRLQGGGDNRLLRGANALLPPK